MFENVKKRDSSRKKKERKRKKNDENLYEIYCRSPFSQ